MSTPQPPELLKNPTPTIKIRVWDLPLRLFHWSLLVAVAGLFITAELDGFSWGDNALQIHFYLGYVVLILLLFRIVWGLVGSRYARFNSFRINPIAAWQTLKGKPYSPLGHNPLGALSVYTLLLSLTVQVITGLFSNDSLDTYALLALEISQDTSDLITQYHKINQKILIALIVTHVLAIAVYHFKYRKPLTRTMITGDIRTDACLKPAAALDNARIRWKALVILVICIAVVVLIIKNKK
jgi:cytochrome b